MSENGLHGFLSWLCFGLFFGDDDMLDIAVYAFVKAFEAAWLSKDGEAFLAL
jgi:hypothetical protein